MNITYQAYLRIKALLQSQPTKAYLRVYIHGGGCSGFQYGFDLQEEKQSDDVLVEQSFDNDVVILLIDPISINYLNAATLDFKKDMMGQRFIVNNPRVKTTCGCVQSFSLDV